MVVAAPYTEGSSCCIPGNAQYTPSDEFPKPHCQQQSCLRPASYAYNNEKVPAFCEKHKMEGMQNVVHPNRGDCIHEGCARVSSYASTSDTLANFCHLHKKQGMVKVRDKIGTRCEEVTCVKQASFAMECQRYPRFCKDHKQQGMVNIRNHRCLAPGCSRGASFAVVGDRRGIYCGEHKLTGMVNTRRRPRCIKPGCNSRKPVFVLHGQQLPKFCSDHGGVGMAHIRPPTSIQGVVQGRARQPDKAAVAAMGGGTHSISRDMRTSGLAPRPYPHSNGIGRNAPDSSRSPSSSSSSSPSIIAVPGEYKSPRFQRGVECGTPRAHKGVNIESPRVQAAIPPGASSSSSPRSKIGLPGKFGIPRFQRGVEFGSPRTQGGVGFRSPREQEGAPLSPSIKRHRASTDSEPVPGTAQSDHEQVPPHAQPRTRPWYTTMETEGRRKLVGGSQEPCPPAGIRAPDDDTYCERFRKLVGAPGERSVLTDSQTPDGDARCDSRVADSRRPSDIDTRSGNGAAGYRRPSYTDSDTGAVGYRRPSDSDTHCDIETVGYRRWSMPPSTSTRATVERNASGFGNPGGQRCGGQPAHPVDRTSDDKRCGGQPAHALIRAASGSFATGAAVRAGRRVEVDVVIEEEPLPAAKTSGDTYRDTTVVDARSNAGAVDYRRPSGADTHCAISAVGCRGLGTDTHGDTRGVGYRPPEADTHSDTGVVRHRRWSIPPSASTDIERNPSGFVNVDDKRCGSPRAHPVDLTSDDIRCGGRPAHPSNRASDSDRCDGQPAHLLNSGASGSFATGTAVRVGRKAGVVVEEPPAATETSSKDFSERARSSSDLRSPQFLTCKTDRTTGVRIRFRVPYAPSFDDTQSVFPDTRPDTRQSSTTSGGVSHAHDVPSDVGDVAHPSERRTNKNECYATTKKPDVLKERGWGKLLAQEEAAAVAKRGNLENSQHPGYARTSFYFNLVEALTKKLEARGSSSTH